MLIIKQKGFDDFRCIAGRCPDNCCSCWQICADDEAMKHYELLAKNDLFVKEGLDLPNNCLRQEKGSCHFLGADGLCYLQRTYGEEALCKTCHEFPRHVEEYENVREYSLSLSCPYEAKRLLGETEPMSFSEHWEDENEEFEEFDELFYDKLIDARNCLYEMAQDRSRPLQERLERIALFGSKTQELIENDRIFEIDDLIEESKTCQNALHSGASCFLNDPDYLKGSFGVLFSLETLRSDWILRLEQTWQTFFGSDAGGEQGLEQYMKENETAGEQILMLFLYTYFCGAVYDGWAFSKTQLAVLSVRWIFMIAFSMGAAKEKLEENAYLFAREIEHSDLNLDRLEEWFMDHRR